MLGKSKELGGRYGGLPADLMRVVNKGLDLLNSNAADSDHELLELVKKAKREMDKEPPPVHHSKKIRAGRASAEQTEAQASGHRASSSVLSGDHVSSGSDSAAPPNSLSPSTAASSAGMGHAQARLMNVIRSGTARGRSDKTKRKGSR